MWFIAAQFAVANDWPQAQWLIVVDLVALTGKCHGGILTVVDKHASASQNVFGPRISSAN